MKAARTSVGMARKEGERSFRRWLLPIARKRRFCHNIRGPKWYKNLRWGDVYLKDGGVR